MCCQREALERFASSCALGIGPSEPGVSTQPARVTMASGEAGDVKPEKERNAACTCATKTDDMVQARIHAGLDGRPGPKNVLPFSGLSLPPCKTYLSNHLPFLSLVMEVLDLPPTPSPTLGLSPEPEKGCCSEGETSGRNTPDPA